MSLLQVDRDSCTMCGVCAQVCPCALIKVDAAGKGVAAVEEAQSSCINCGHCVAVCSQSALSLPGMAPQQCPPIPQPGWSPGEGEGFLRARRSIRNYLRQPVDRITLQSLLRMASYAPSGHNSQPLKWAVVSDSDRLAALGDHVAEWMRSLIRGTPAAARAMHLEEVVASWEAGSDVIFRGAPHLVFAYAHKKNPFAATAAPIALAYLELAAPSLGLGACWLGYFHAAAVAWPEVGTALDLPEGHICLGAVAVGKPKHRYHRLPLRKEPEIRWD